MNIVCFQFAKTERFEKDSYYSYSSYCYEDANLYSKATFSWLTPLLRLGNSSPLELEDLGSIPHSESTAIHFEKFQDVYNSLKVREYMKIYILEKWNIVIIKK